MAQELKKKRGRKKIGDRENFCCPDDLHAYIESYRTRNHIGDWSEALRQILYEHREQNIVRNKTSLIDSKSRVN